MSVMPGSCLVFNVTGVDGNLPRFFFRSTINVFVGHGFTPSLLGKDLGDGLCKSGFAVIDMADGADVDVRFVTVEFVSCGGKRTAGDVKSWSVLRGQHTLGGLLSNGGSEAVHVGMEAVAQRRRIQKSNDCADMLDLAWRGREERSEVAADRSSKKKKSEPIYKSLDQKCHLS